MDQPQPQPERPFGIERAMELLGITRRSDFYKLVRAGLFPRPRRFGRGWGYTVGDWKAYLLLSSRWRPGPFNAEKDEPAGEEADDGAEE